MKQNLIDWVTKHKLKVLESEHGSNIVLIEGVGKFLHIEHKDGKIIDEDFAFIMDEEELEIIENEEISINFILFEFGSCFYYSKIKTDTNKYGEIIYKPEFKDFRYLSNTSEEEVIDFVHLGVHGEYEILNGSGNADLWCKKAKFLNHKAIGICDKNTLAGTLSFQSSCLSNGLKPIFGETISVALEYEAEKQHQIIFELKLYVLNEIGWKNLLNVNRKIRVEHETFIPIEELYEFGEGLCCVIPKDSELNFYKDDIKRCTKLIKRLKKYFDSVYYQIDTVEYVSESKFKEHLSNLDAYLTNYTSILEPILINDSYYLESEESIVKEMLNSVSGNAGENKSNNQFFKDFDDTIKAYESWLESVEPLYEAIVLGIENASELANKADFKIDTGNRKLPAFEVKDVESKFYKEIGKGVESRLSHLTEKELDVYMNQLEIECNVIVPNGLCDYFMILWDICNWCHKNGILVGAGRGSVCGSLVAYLLRITDVDPLKYGLMFERFLNETRVSGERAKSADSMPDIDIDFPAEHRDAVKNYVIEKYGYDYTCSIGTYGRMKIKTCIKDFGKVKGLSFDETNMLTKDIDDKEQEEWSNFIEYGTKSKQMFKFIQGNKDIVMLTKYAIMQCKAESVHPSAIIIVPKFTENKEERNVFEWMPIKTINNVLVSEWEGKYIDKSGFLKEDILGLTQLDKFDAIMKLIYKNSKEKIELTEIPLDDEDVFKYFKKGWCEDVFQFGTVGLMNYCRQVKPETLDHLIAMTALFRPGPMESNAHNDFADIKNGKKKPHFDFGLKEVTEDTYGLYVYQEQIMKAVNVLGGLSLVEADQLRTYMKKKDKKSMAALSEKFIAGAMEKGCDKKEAEKIWEKLDKFSGYGFNKSHAAAYSLMSYWSQWFKVNYPLEFWTVCLQFAKEEQVPFRLSELRKTGVDITIRPPDVNYSGSNFTCDYTNNFIFFSVKKIKGLGEVAVESLVETRNKGGKFFDFEDFISRVPSKVNKSVVCSLIVAGAFDLIYNIKYPKQRKELLEHYLLEIKKEKVLPEKFDLPESKTNNFWTELQRTISGYGNVDYTSLIKKKVNSERFLKLYKDGFELVNVKDNTEVSVAGKVIVVKENDTKNGKMAYITIANNNDNILLQFWPTEWESNKDSFQKFKDKTIAVNGICKFNSFKGSRVIYFNQKSKIYEL